MKINPQLSSAEGNDISETDDATSMRSDAIPMDDPVGVENYRNEMKKVIEKNVENVAAIRARMKNEKKEINPDLATTIFELELANGFMKIKLLDFNPSEKNSWDLFKAEFSGGMAELNREFKVLTDSLQKK